MLEAPVLEGVFYVYQLLGKFKLKKANQIADDLKYIPIGRLGAPAEVAAVASMLVSDSGAFVNGQMIQVNGGAAM